jgi:hypothetical protein
VPRETSAIIIVPGFLQMRKRFLIAIRAP